MWREIMNGMRCLQESRKQKKSQWKERKKHANWKSFDFKYLVCLFWLDLFFWMCCKCYYVYIHTDIQTVKSTGWLVISCFISAMACCYIYCSGSLLPIIHMIWVRVNLKYTCDLMSFAYLGTASVIIWELSACLAFYMDGMEKMLSLRLEFLH